MGGEFVFTINLDRGTISPLIGNPPSEANIVTINLDVGTIDLDGGGGFLLGGGGGGFLLRGGGDYAGVFKAREAAACSKRLYADNYLHTQSGSGHATVGAARRFRTSRINLLGGASGP